MPQWVAQYWDKWNLEELGGLVGQKFFLLAGAVCLFSLLRMILRLVVKRVLVPSLRLSNRELGRQKTISRLIESVLIYLLYFLLLYTILTILGLPVASLFAGAGIAGLAIGLGAQGFLSDLINGFFILLEGQFDVGDVVRLSNGPIALTGTVVSMGIRTSQLRDADGTLHFIPNRNILVVSNQSRGDMRAQIDLPLKLTTDLDKVARVIEAVNQRELPRFPQVTGVKVLGPQHALNGQFCYRVHLFVHHGQQSSLYHQFYALYQEALLAAGVELPTGSAAMGPV